MENEKFLNKYRIKSARATWHDYSAGTYFITICTNNREHFFGEIDNGIMQLSEIGKYMFDNLLNINSHYPYTEIPLFVVMPNHWHAIVYIDGDKTPYIRRDTSVETWHAASLRATSLQTKNEQMRNIANMQGWLSVAIGGIKSAVSKFAHDNDMDFAWQTRFHDHIIRNQNEMNRIADYIDNNPTTWESDCFK